MDTKTPQENVTQARWSWTDLWKKEDWWAIWLGILLLASVFTGLVDSVPKMAKWNWGDFGDIFPMESLLPFAVLILGLCVIYSLAIWILERKSIWGYIPAFVIVFLMCMVAEALANEATMKVYGIGFAFWALAIGLLISNTFGTPAWLKRGARTEFYIKTGLVIMGAEIIFGSIQKFGVYGLLIAWGVTPVVIVFMWLFGTRILKMANKPLVITVATATSVCGVSAAIAAAAASRAKKEDLTIAVGMSLLFTVVMMVTMPIFIKMMGMSEVLGGAWMGGTIDATGAVVLAGETLGEQAEAVAAIVKMIQNILIGVVAFFIALFWVTSVDRDPNAPRPGLSEIWLRFPKFILGFVAASVLVSYVAIPLMTEDTVNGFLKQTKNYRGWLFCMAFISIGLESNFKDMKNQMVGGKPLVLYLVGQGFNLVLTLFIAWLVLSGIILPAPPVL